MPDQARRSRGSRLVRNAIFNRNHLFFSQRGRRNGGMMPRRILTRRQQVEKLLVLIGDSLPIVDFANSVWSACAESSGQRCVLFDQTNLRRQIERIVKQQPMLVQNLVIEGIVTRQNATAGSQCMQ